MNYSGSSCFKEINQNSNDRDDNSKQQTMLLEQIKHDSRAGAKGKLARWSQNGWIQFTLQWMITNRFHPIPYLFQEQRRKEDRPHVAQEARFVLSIKYPIPSTTILHLLKQCLCLQRQKPTPAGYVPGNCEQSGQFHCKYRTTPPNLLITQNQSLGGSRDQISSFYCSIFRIF